MKKKKKKKVSKKTWMDTNGDMHPGEHPNPPKGPSFCYSDDLRRWISKKEFLEIARADIKSTQIQEFTPVQQAISEFFEESSGYPLPCAVGYYLGLPEYLEEKSLKKSAKRCIIKFPKKNFIMDINAAWALYRLRHPTVFVPLQPDPKLDAKEKSERRKKIFDCDISSVIRRLGKEGFDADEVRMIMDHFGVECKDTTIKGQLWCSTQHGKYGLSANLNEWQMDQIFNALIESKKKNRSEK